MSQYTNSVHIAINDAKTEVFINFSLISVDADNQQTNEPVANLVMSRDMASSLADIIQQGLSHNE